MNEFIPYSVTYIATSECDTFHSQLWSESVHVTFQMTGNWSLNPNSAMKRWSDMIWISYWQRELWRKQPDAEVQKLILPMWQCQTKIIWPHPYFSQIMNVPASKKHGCALFYVRLGLSTRGPPFAAALLTFVVWYVGFQIFEFFE